jgi:hypothetical protein
MVTTGTSEAASYTTTSYYEDCENLKMLLDFLRSRRGPSVCKASLLGTRVDYLKGK